MNTETMKMVHIMLEDADTAFNTSGNLSKRTITVMIEAMLIAVIMLFRSDNIHFAVLISSLSLIVVFTNLYLLGDYNTRAKMFEACSSEFKERHLSESITRKRYESDLQADLINLIEITERYVRLYRIICIINAITVLFTLTLLIMAVAHVYTVMH